ncbi:unnamed protein product, partial [Mesorhabditis spiculigera]
MSPQPACQSQGRKRRRAEIPNPANTLDGLVARRVEEGKGPAGRYLTEDEAIVSPDDHFDVRENTGPDPDVSARTCSICGYQGKWVSEMIRHKRVHTAERPFKCRYCSRTSKWKADLIRHVAKTHGIRVVSKYSRSKAFDARRNSAEIEPITCSPPLLTLQNPQPSRRMVQLYGCKICPFEHEQLSMFVIHAGSRHGLPAFSCGCGLPFDTSEAVQEHCRLHGFPHEHAIPNFVVRYHESSPVSTLSPSSLSEASSASSADSGVHSDTEDSEQEALPQINTQLPNPFRGLEALLLLGSGLCSPLPSPIPLLSPQAPQFDLATVLLALQAQQRMAGLLQSPTMLSPSENSAFSPTGRGPATVIPAMRGMENSELVAGCSLCEAAFSTQEALAAHLPFHGSARPHQCPNCNYAASKPTNLSRHQATHHRTVPNQLLISLCEEPEADEDSDEDLILDIEQ